MPTQTEEMQLACSLAFDFLSRMKVPEQDQPQLNRILRTIQRAIGDPRQFTEKATARIQLMRDLARDLVKATIHDEAKDVIPYTPEIASDARELAKLVLGEE